MPRPPVIEINDDFADLIGEPTAQRLVSRVHSTGDCQTCGNSLGTHPVNLNAQCLTRSPDGLGPWVITAHHAHCHPASMTKTGSVTIDSSIGITYRAVALTLKPGRGGSGRWLEAMRGSGAGIELPLPILWVCPSIDFFLIDVVSPGNAIDTDLQQYLQEPGFHNMVDSFPDPQALKGPKGSVAILDDGLLITTPPMGFSLAIDPGGPYEQAIRTNSGVLALVSTYGGIHTPGLIDHAMEPLITAGEVAGAWVPLAPPGTTNN